MVKATTSFDSEVSDSVEIIIEGELVNTYSANQEMIFYPNPVNHILYFDQVVEQVELMDILGKCIKTDSFVDNINVSGIIPGIYWIRMKIENHYSIRKVLIEL